MTSEVETNIVAVERIKEYGETPQEAAWEIEDRKVPDNWPDKGEIKFNDFRVRYREGLELVLKGLTFTVNGGEKVRSIVRIILFNAYEFVNKYSIYKFSGWHCWPNRCRKIISHVEFV